MTQQGGASTNNTNMGQLQKWQIAVKYMGMATDFGRFKHLKRHTRQNQIVLKTKPTVENEKL